MCRSEALQKRHGLKCLPFTVIELKYDDGLIWVNEDKMNRLCDPRTKYGRWQEEMEEDRGGQLGKSPCSLPSTYVTLAPAR